MTIKSYIQKEKPTLLIQARVDHDLALKLRTKLKKDKVFIKSFLEAAIQAYLNEK